MALTVVYTTKAIDCPPPSTWSTPLDPEAATPNVFLSVVTGSSAPPSTSIARINEALSRVEQLGRGGGGVYAVQGAGLQLSYTSGLTLIYSAGATISDAPRDIAAGTLAISPNVYSWIYVTRAGTVTQESRSVASGTASPPALPAFSIFLGRVRSDATTLTEIDYSGRFDLRGNLALRETADATKPTDTPSAAVRFLTRITDNSLYLWDGENYSLITQNTADLISDLAALEARVDELSGILGALVRDYHVTLEVTPSEELADPFCRAVVNPYAVV